MNKQVNELPLIALRGMTILPHMVIHFDVSRKKSIQSIDYAMKNGQTIFLATQKSADIIEPQAEDVSEYGTLSEIKQIVKLPGGLCRVLVKGVARGRLLSFESGKDGLMAKIEVEPETAVDVSETEQYAMCDTIMELMEDFYTSTERKMDETLPRLKAVTDIYELIYKCTAECTDNPQLRQDILAAATVKEKFDYLADIINKEIQITEIKVDLAAQMKSRVDRHQKEYIMKEQLKFIREELGEDDFDEEVIELKKKTDRLNAPDYVKEKLHKEIRNYENIPGSSSESYVVKSYIETVLSLPWNERTEENKDIVHAEKVLDKDHYGLIKVKERVLEFLAVHAIKSDSEAPIICLVGPPGTGKTSIAASIATAVNRKYVRICLGGVRDEAEIRGHRKTYVGAMPGRVVEALTQAKVSNPLMLLDEIDKVGTDSRGDTASALLEILDSAQNKAFRDHYVEIPVDLSGCLFIATANDTSTIPKPLLDRMEVIELNSYTQIEKFHIAKKYLVKKQLKNTGLNSKQVSFSNSAINLIIDGYTKEAGVRELERMIGSVCRKAARKILSGEQEVHKITATNLKDYLGTVKYDKEDVLNKDEIGIARGLAWTSVGGTTLDVETCLMDGKGEIKITGQLGDVMKESAMVAMGYIRSQADKYNIDKELFTKKDIHIHVPEGAVPKDGPSAGITMTLAMISVYTGRKICHKTAMTGEITLHGKVLPIGGLKEKMLAAKNVGIKNILVPYKNEKDVLDMEKEITEGMNIIYVKHMDDVIKAALR